MVSSVQERVSSSPSQLSAVDHQHQQKNGQEGSAIVHAVNNLAVLVEQASLENRVSLDALVTEQTLEQFSVPDFYQDETNLIDGQVNGFFAEEIIAGNPDLMTTLFPELSSPSSQAIALKSVLGPAQHQKIGLMRYPSLPEHNIQRFDYNLSMVHELLRLGYEVRHAFLNGRKLVLKDLWNSCRVWRVGRLSTQTEWEDIEPFFMARLGVCSFSVTPFSDESPCYAHLLRFLRNELKKLEPIADDEVRVFQYRHSTSLQGEQVPLTLLRAAFDSKQACVRQEFLVTETAHLELPEGGMVHLEPQFIELASLEIQTKLDELLSLFDPHLFDNATSMATSDPKDSRFSVVIETLADIHYLLAHAMFDRRGSSAKGELFVRSLAAALGLELPPFRQGFVPDLEAFMRSREDFIANYSNVFDVAGGYGGFFKE